jgi:hypothetical protein
MTQVVIYMLTGLSKMYHHNGFFFGASAVHSERMRYSLW